MFGSFYQVLVDQISIMHVGVNIGEAKETETDNIQGSEKLDPMLVV